MGFNSTFKGLIFNGGKDKYCSQTFLVYSFIRFACISYGQFIAIHCLSLYSQCMFKNCSRYVGGVVYGEGLKRGNGRQKITDASSPVRKIL